MHVTCESCGTVYRVEERLLGSTGRMVRCTECQATWLQAGPTPPPEEEKPAEIDLDWTKPAPPQDEFLTMVKAEGQNTALSVITEPIPADFEIPVMTHRPLGMEAGQFGAAVFLALVFTALLGLFAFKGAVTAHFPAMAAFYGKIGFSTKAPGEGFQLSETVVENRVAGVQRNLAVQVKLGNMTDHEMATPVLNIKMLGEFGGTIKTWAYTPEKPEKLAAGETIPLEMVFNDAPEDGKSVEVTISE